ncbi:DNA/RNA non-specific endonuclease [Microvirga sp. STS02]|uniref:DNA/RNA non-specific endonuclease n=1 Tax=Hymenobacter negativus TaxID=2795026 RepID=UPI0018DDE117|nr:MULTISPECIES: DNA/RNA non-specific endonuclease [Bacteria]MBH8567730.1 DNA/RNA non-specific endonuclease [Hymenobacter negativus]MBR7207464.1 DNA/RNA non-specific endonuclease [Microvirga sp. STS02]
MLASDVSSQRWDQLQPVKNPGTWLLKADKAAIHLALPAPEARRREHFLAADGQQPTNLELEVLRGNNDLLQVNFLDRCLLVRQAVGRLEAHQDNQRILATGFMVAPGLLLTNNHVLPEPGIAETGSVEFNAWYDVAGEAGPTVRFDLNPAAFFVTDQELDYTLVAVQATSRSGRALLAEQGYLRLFPSSGKVGVNECVTIIQHPDGELMQIALRENQVTRAQEDENFIQYETDTAHGSSGAPVFNDSLQVAALHSGGRIKRDAQQAYVLKDGTTRPTLDGLRESDVEWEANAGIRVSAICTNLLMQARQRYPAFVAVLEQAMAGGDILGRAIVQVSTSGPDHVSPPSSSLMQAESRRSETSLESTPPQTNTGIAIPLTLRISLEGPQLRAEPADTGTKSLLSAATGLETEAFKQQIPVIYDDLASRQGYQPDFLALDGGAVVALPQLTAAGRAVVAPLLEGGGYELRYHKFSVVMHKQRRLALFTAANVDWIQSHREINGHKPTRAELTSIPDMVTEEWVPDARIAAAHQLSDIFYTDDHKAFDKGHLVRRDDVCWGNTFEDMQMANGDTYHITNCSPQIKGFNQAAYGVDNWGDLEAEVAKQTKAEKVILFSGPVLAPDDRWFRGKDSTGEVRVQIPNRFWKIVVAKETTGPKAYGFVLEQDVQAITEKEFKVTPTWKSKLVPIATITGLLRGWVDLSALEAISA